MTKRVLRSNQNDNRKHYELEAMPYLQGHPEITENNLEKCENLLFYQNNIPSRPKGDYIENILSEWKGNYDLLEAHHGYIQWLFPLRTSGVNFKVDPMQEHEMLAIRSSPQLSARVIRAYELMLDFYGLRLVDGDTGQVDMAENFRPRISFLNVSYHNFLRISRILKSLGELGFEHLKAPLVKLFIKLCFAGVSPLLRNARKACENHWIFTLRIEAERNELISLIDQFKNVQYEH